MIKHIHTLIPKRTPLLLSGPGVLGIGTLVGAGIALGKGIADLKQGKCDVGDVASAVAKGAIEGGGIGTIISALPALHRLVSTTGLPQKRTIRDSRWLAAKTID